MRRAQVHAARAGFPEWSQSGIQMHQDALKRVGDKILARRAEHGSLLSSDEGKPLGAGIAEVVRAAQIFPYFSGNRLRLSGDRIMPTRPGVEVAREPLGVMGTMTPWNSRW